MQQEDSPLNMPQAITGNSSNNTIHNHLIKEADSTSNQLLGQTLVQQEELHWEAAVKQYGMEVKNSHLLRFSLIEEKFALLANNRPYSSNTPARREYDKSNLMKEKLLNYIQLNKSSKHNNRNELQEIKKQIKKCQMKNSKFKTKERKSKDITKHSKLLHCENNYNNDYEHDSIPISDIDKWGSLHESFSLENSCENLAERSTRNNAPINSVVSNCPSKSSIKTKQKPRPLKSNVSHRRMNKIKAHLGNSVKGVDKEMNSFNKIKKVEKNASKKEPISESSKKNIKRGHPPKSNLNIQLQLDLGNEYGDHIKKLITESSKKNIRKRGCPPKSNLNSIVESDMGDNIGIHIKEFNTESFKKNIRKRGRPPESNLNPIVDSKMGDNNGIYIKGSITESFEENIRKRGRPPKSNLNSIVDSEMGDDNGIFIKGSITGSFEKNIKRGCPPKSRTRRENRVKTQLKFSSNIFNIDTVDDFTNTGNNIKGSKILHNVVNTKNNKMFTTDVTNLNSYCQKVSKKKNLMMNKDESYNFTQTIPYSKYCVLMEDLSLHVESNFKLKEKNVLCALPLYVSNNKDAATKNNKAQNCPISLVQKQANSFQEEKFLNACSAVNPKYLSHKRNIENNLSKQDSKRIKAKHNQLTNKRTPVEENIAKKVLENEEESANSCSEIYQKILANEYSNPKSFPSSEQIKSTNEYPNVKTSGSFEQKLKRKQTAKNPRLQDKFLKSLNLTDVHGSNQQKAQKKNLNEAMNLKQMIQNSAKYVKESMKPSKHQKLEKKYIFELKGLQVDLNRSPNNLQDLEMIETENPFLTLDNEQQASPRNQKVSFEQKKSQNKSNTEPKILNTVFLEPNLSLKKINSEAKLLEQSKTLNVNAIFTSDLKNNSTLNTSLATIKENSSSLSGSSMEKLSQSLNKLKNGTEIKNNFENREETNVFSLTNAADSKTQSLKLRLNSVEPKINSTLFPMKRKENERSLLTASESSSMNYLSESKNEPRNSQQKKLMSKLNTPTSPFSCKRTQSTSNSSDFLTNLSAPFYTLVSRDNIDLSTEKENSRKSNLRNGTEINDNLENREGTNVIFHANAAESKTRSLKPKFNSVGPTINSSLLPVRSKEYERSLLAASNSSSMKNLSKQVNSNESKKEPSNFQHHEKLKIKINTATSPFSCEETPTIPDSHENELPINLSAAYTLISLDGIDLSTGKQEYFNLGYSFSKFDRTFKN